MAEEKHREDGDCPGAKAANEADKPQPHGFIAAEEPGIVILGLTADAPDRTSCREDPHARNAPAGVGMPAAADSPAGDIPGTDAAGGAPGADETSAAADSPAEANVPAQAAIRFGTAQIGFSFSLAPDGCGAFGADGRLWIGGAPSVTEAEGAFLPVAAEIAAVRPSDRQGSSETHDDPPRLPDAPYRKEVKNADASIGAGRLLLACGGEDGEVRTELRCGGDGLSVVQSGRSDAGISRLVFRLRLEDPFCVIVPAWNGVRLSKEHPLFWTGWTDRVVSGETTLQLQMLLLEGKEGGILLCSEDDGSCFKGFTVRRRGDGFDITVESIPQAPFAGQTRFVAPRWRMVPYRGGWQQGAALYRRLIEEPFALREANRLRPDWIGEIALMVLTDMTDRAELEALAGRFDPRRTLLHVPAWRKEEYDVNWPDYTPRDDMKEMIDFAHSLGFRVQLHCNMHGCQPDRPEYDRFGGAHCRKPFLDGWENADFSDARRHYLFARINPASSAWRRFIVARLTEAAKSLGADSIHLDESLLCHNDGNGLLDGMTSQQGCVAYHRELAQSLPSGTAIGGEGVTDCNARYASFLQSHVYAVDFAEGRWVLDRAMAEQIVPLTAAVYPEALGYHWPGLPVTARESEYLMWYLTGAAIGHLPTLMRESAHSLTDGATPTVGMVLREAAWYAENRPQRCFEGWKEGVLMRWRLKNGGYAVFRRIGDAYYLFGNEDDPDSVISAVGFGADGVLRVLPPCAE